MLSHCLNNNGDDFRLSNFNSEEFVVYSIAGQDVLGAEAHLLDSEYQVVLAHALNDHGDGTRFGNEGLVVAILQCQIGQ